MPPKDNRRQLIGRVREQKREIAQLIQDVESWNDNNPWGESIDMGMDQLYVKNAKLDGVLRELTSDT